MKLSNLFAGSVSLLMVVSGVAPAISQTVGNLNPTGGTGSGDNTTIPTNPNQVNGTGNAGGGNTSTTGAGTNASSNSNSGISGAGSGVTQSPDLTQSPQITTGGATGGSITAPLTTGPSSATTGPSSAAIDSAIKNAVNVDPTITNTASLKQMLQSNPELTAKLNSSNKAEQAQAMKSITNSSAYQTLTGNKTNVSTPVTISQPTTNNTSIKNNVFTPAPIFVPQGNAGAGCTFTVQNGSVVVSYDQRAIVRTHGLSVAGQFGDNAGQVQIVGSKVVGNATCPKDLPVKSGFDAVIGTIGSPDPNAEARARQQQAEQQAQAQRQTVTLYLNSGGIVRSRDSRDSK